jgi:hypothetical protein
MVYRVYMPFFDIIKYIDQLNRYDPRASLQLRSALSRGMLQGSPYTYLRSETLAALGFTEIIPGETDVLIHGCAASYGVSVWKTFRRSGYFGSEVQLQKFLNDISGMIHISFVGKSFSSRE